MPRALDPSGPWIWQICCRHECNQQFSLVCHSSVEVLIASRLCWNSIPKSWVSYSCTQTSRANTAKSQEQQQNTKEGGALSWQFSPSGRTEQDPAGSAGVATLAEGLSQGQMGKVSLQGWFAVSLGASDPLPVGILVL